MLTLTEIMDKLGCNIHIAQQVKYLVSPKRKRATKAKACGHCGGRAKVNVIKADVYYVGCVAPDCRHPLTCCHKTRQGAIDEWNEQTV